ncbi:MAG: hypothetical protein KatS3mg113_0569 [Planctomycetaceae bacterium]|nr:MAG: hypothetical protein KatS3mg113_0569 [Planctomycetaceae bacterium]
MQEQAIKLIQQIPLESYVWISIFSTQPRQPWVPRFSTEADREQVIKTLRYGLGNPNGGTALYDSLGRAFEEAERITQNYPNRYVAVLAYTDGADTNSRTWNPQKLSQRFNQLVDQNSNLWFYYTRVPGDGKPLQEILPSSPHSSEEPFRPPLILQLKKASFVLNHPVLQPRQAVQLEFYAEDTTWKSLAKVHELVVQFVPEQPNKPKLKVSSLRLQPGPQTVDLFVENPRDLVLDEAYRGRLVITYPELKDLTIKAPSEVELFFPAGEKIPIHALRPEPHSEHPVGKPITFIVNTWANARVL